MHSPFDQQSNQSSTLIPSRYELDKHQTNCKEVTLAKDLRNIALLPHRFEEKNIALLHHNMLHLLQVVHWILRWHRLCLSWGHWHWQSRLTW